MIASGSAALNQIKYVLLIDPGNYATISGSCDSSLGKYLAQWLQRVPDAHLVVLSGPVTLDYQNPRNGYASAGIQTFYFNPIRALDVAGNLRSRVLVCNYLDPTESIKQSHQTMFARSQGYVAQPFSSACPSLSAPLNYAGSWKP